MNDRQFKKMLDWLGLSRDGYYKVRKGVKKRIRKHMQQCGCRDIDAYLALLEQDPRSKEQCRMLLTVSISRFFRDRELWQILESEILPELIFKNRDRIRVWSAGCARGEEIYSFKILWDILGDRLSFMPKLEAWATDMNPAYIAAARQGIYSAGSLKQLPDEFKSRYFERLDKRPLFALRDSIKRGISWKIVDLLYGDPPAEGFQLVFLRNNILTYYGESLLQQALKKVTESLASGGWLIIGAKERLPETADQIQPCSRYPGLFVRKDTDRPG